jgi:hypothetical protein
MGRPPVPIAFKDGDVVDTDVLGETAGPKPRGRIFAVDRGEGRYAEYCALLPMPAVDIDPSNCGCETGVTLESSADFPLQASSFSISFLLFSSA